MRPATENTEPTSSQLGETARFYWLFPLVVALVLVLAGEIGLTRVPNGLLFDVATRHLAAKEPKAVLFEPSGEIDPGQVDWALAVTLLRRLGAEKIVFTFDPFARPNPSERGPDIIVGGPPQPVPGKPGRWRLQDQEPSPRIQHAVAVVPPSEHGIFRRQWLWIPSPEGRLPTIEAMAAGQTLNGPSDFLIAMPSREVLPRVPLEQLFSKVFPDDLLRGKIAVVGPGRFVDPPRYVTPATAGKPQVNRAEFHTRAIQSLLAGRAIQPVTGVWRALLLFGFSVLLVRLLARSDPSALARNLTIGVLLTVGLGYAMLALADLMLPLTELLLAPLVLGFMIFRQKEMLQDERLVRVVDRTTAYVARHALLTDLNRWPDFLATAARLGGIEQWLLFEKLNGGAVEVLASQGHIDENVNAQIRYLPLLKRADEARPAPVPAGESLFRLPGKAHLVRLTNSERRIYWLYHIPLGDSHEASSANAAKRISHSLVAALDLEYADPAAKMQSDRFKSLDNRVAHSMDLIVSRSTELRQSLAAMQTAMILYDAAGMPLHTNASMRRILRSLQLDVAESTPVDVAEKLTSIDGGASRSMLKELVLTGGELRLSAAQELEGRRYVLRVNNVQNEVGEPTGGLLFEAIDVTEVDRMAQVQRELASQIDSQIRNDLEAIQLAARLASDGRLSRERQNKALAHVLEATARARNTLNSIGELLDRALRVGMPDPYPVNPKHSLIRALSCVRSRADELGVELKLEQPGLTTAVIAEPALLDELVEALVRVVLNDSPRGSVVAAELLELESESAIVVTGGFGLPPDRLDDILGGRGKGGSEEFRVIAQATEVLPAWGGVIEASSEPGAGYSFKVRLRKV